MNRSEHAGAARPASTDDWTITVGGLVDQPATLTVQDLRALAPAIEVRPEVDCADGIATRGAVYQGVALEDLLRLAGPKAEGQHVVVHSGPYAAGFSLETLPRRGAVLAFERNGAEMSWDDGGPVRLVVVVGACFDTVKWVDRITVERDLASATALDFVRQRRGQAVQD